MYLPAIMLVCLSTVQPFFCYEEANMDSTVIFEYLGIDPKSVTNHKLTTVQVQRTHKRDLQQGTAITFQAINEEISLWLRPLDSMLASNKTPVYYAHYAPGYLQEVYFEKVDNAMEDVRQLLEDPKHYATVILSADDSGQTTVNGHLTSPGNDARLVITPLPRSIVKGLLGNQISINDTIDDAAHPAYHVIVEIYDKDDLQNIATTEHHGVEPNKMTSSNNAATTNQRLDTLYPQMLIQVDYLSYYLWSHKRLSFMLEYILAFWNGVDLMYRQLENPKMRFNIAGIIISKDARATPYLWNNMIVTNVSLDATRAIVEAAIFFYSVERASPIVDFDTAAIMTGMYGASKDIQSGFALGGWVADIGTMCSRNHNAKRNEGVLIILDNSQHRGIHTAAHEIAHLLGAEHESTNSHNQCTQVEGALMDATPTSSSNISRFTSCVLQDIRAQYNKGALDCLKNVPQMEDAKLPGLMPGKTWDIIEQCSDNGYGRPCYPNGSYVDVCAGLWCVKWNEREIICESTGIPAPPGIACLKENLTEHGICLKNRCVSI